MSKVVSLSLSQELVDALDHLAKSREDSRSAVVEMLLREHEMTLAAIERVRDGQDPAPQKEWEPVGKRHRLRIRGDVRVD